MNPATHGGAAVERIDIIANPLDFTNTGDLTSDVRFPVLT
jgi:hypothetical protein